METQHERMTLDQLQVRTRTMAVRVVALVRAMPREVAAQEMGR